MHGSLSAAWLLVALCAATGAYCLLRLRSGVEEQRRTAGGEALMGFGMALMAVPAAVLAPPRWAWLLYAVVFGGAALRALWTSRAAPGHHLHHLVGTFAMAYMALAMALRPEAHAHHGGTGAPVLTGLLLVYFAGYVLWTGARLVPPVPVPGGAVPGGVVSGGAVRGGSSGGAVPGRTAPGGPVPGGWGDRPELARACRLSMGIGMLAMLLAM
ncbi:DUF5134 domain-containing protein [Streptomyces sp. NPDC088785]|uniref:DUF5134 domain-containing protein n=1 Tax=Streptomyces sp. NPDC088785 TaxID=3365897 RepID=UPI00382E3BC5